MKIFCADIGSFNVMKFLVKGTMRLLFPIAFLCLPVFLLSQPTAKFTSDVTEGCSPLVVKFQDLSTGNIKEWKWYFGNGGNSDSANPSSSYVNSGTYDVKLVVTDQNNQKDSITKNKYIQVFKNPTAILKGAPRTGCIPHSVNFTDISTRGSGQIIQWLWDFGDGGITGKQHPVHTYLQKGSFSVSLTVTDTNGCRDLAVKSSYINTVPSPRAGFKVNKTYSCDTPFTVSFTDTSKGAGPFNYQWDFGDGSGSAKKDPVHIYRQFGLFDVTLTITDTTGCKDTVEKSGFIRIEKFVPKLDVNLEHGCLSPKKDKFKFEDNSTPFTTFHVWKFGDGSTSNKRNPEHLYQKPGVYEVTLVTGNSGCADTVKDTVYVQQVKAGFSADSLYNCEVPFRVNFSDSSTNAVSWYWDFGDSSYSGTQNPTHVYQGEDSFTVKQRVTNQYGCQDSFERTIVVDTIYGGFIMDPKEGCVPFTIDFYQKVATSDPVKKWEWSFGTGDSSDVPNPSYKYTDTGFFKATLKVTTKRGCQKTFYEYVKAGNKPTASFTANRTKVCVEQPVSFSVSTGIADSLIWNFRDGGPPRKNVQTYEYQDTGTFTVTLKPYHLGCKGKNFKRKNYIHVMGPVADPSFTQVSCDTPFKVEFLDNSKMPDRWKWKFGDGDSSFKQNPVHQYPQKRDTFDISLQVWNDSTGCTHSRKGRVYLTVPVADFLINDSLGCHSLKNVRFDAGISQDADHWENVWYIANMDTIDKKTVGSKDELITPPPQNFDRPGNYRIRLIIFDQNLCPDTAVRFVRVFNHETRFKTDTTIGCPPLKVQFTENTKSGHPVNQWKWDFDDGTVDTTAAPVHTFRNKGKYHVTLYTTDTFGCMDSARKWITVSKPSAQFIINKQIACLRDTVRFQSNPFGDSLFFRWDFGDGTTGNTQDPTHVYRYNDTFSVTLMVRDTNGCRDTFTRKNLVEINQPVARFAMSDSSALCPPLLVKFDDHSLKNIRKWNWDFGDNSGSFLQNPRHNYTRAGKYTVRLIVTNQRGCKDTLVKNQAVQIGGPAIRYKINPDRGCQPLKVNFAAFDKKDVREIVWDFGDGFTAKGDTVSHLYNSPGIFHPTIILDNGKSGNLACRYALANADTITVDTVHAGFELSSGKHGCAGEKIRLSNTSKGDLTSHLWILNGDTLADTSYIPPLQIDTAGSFNLLLKVKNINGCTDTLEKSFTIQPLPRATAKGATFICEGRSTQLHGPQNIQYSYLWFPGKGLSNRRVPNPFASPDTTTSYFVKVTGPYGCENTSDSVEVVVQQKPELRVFYDTAIAMGDTAPIYSKVTMPVENYRWSPADSLFCIPEDTGAPRCSSPFANPMETTQYTLSVQDTSGCFTIPDEVTIEVIDEIRISVPGAFTPNGDGINDVIYVKGWGIKDLIYFRVYNRWGELVFESRDKAHGWDGIFRGKVQNSDTYVWHAKARGYNGKIKVAKGSFTLIK